VLEAPLGPTTISPRIGFDVARNLLPTPGGIWDENHTPTGPAQKRRLYEVVTEDFTTHWRPTRKHRELRMVTKWA
tara:strand:- start:22936 stop:23160 length:225 start_codon:yes stop_codon:yes gene_type:complete